MEWLVNTLPNMIQSGKVLIFVNHIKSCNDLYYLFKEFMADIPREILHGDKL